MNRGSSSDAFTHGCLSKNHNLVVVVVMPAVTSSISTRFVFASLRIPNLVSIRLLF